MLRYKRLYMDSAELYAPKEGDAGYDLPAYMDYTLVPGSVLPINTGIAVEIPYGWVGLVLPRSGIRFNYTVNTLGTGVIDSSYRGEIRVLLTLKTYIPVPFAIHHGDRIAQLVIVPYFHEDVEEVSELSDTRRGADGFGSTGR